MERLKAPVPRPDYASQPTLDEAIADGAKLAEIINVPANNGTVQEFADFRNDYRRGCEGRTVARGRRW